MSRYRSQYPTTLGDFGALVEFLVRELQRVEDAVDALYDGEQEPLREFPPRDQTVLVFGDEDFDLGDGEGLYLRIGQQWYKLDMHAVAGPGGYPETGSVSVEGNTPTVS